MYSPATRRRKQGRIFPKSLVITGGDFPAPLHELIQSFELVQTESAVDVGQAVVITQLLLLVIPASLFLTLNRSTGKMGSIANNAVIAKSLQAPVKVCVVGSYRPAFPGSNLFYRMKAKNAHVGDRAYRSILVGCAQGVGGIIDHNQVMAPGKVHDRINVCRYTGHVHRGDHPRATRDCRLDFVLWHVCRPGVLEDAPQYYAIVTRTPTATSAAQIQQRVISAYPNISAVDLRMVIETIDDILEKAAFVIRFMAGFSVITGLLVLGATVVTSRFDRREEAMLLRTLGAARRQLNQIMAAEYVLLGAIASLAGGILALTASWAMARWLFQMDFAITVWPLITIPTVITGASLGVGVLLNRRLTT